MNVLYCGDENVADGVAISILSLLKNVKDILNIYILTVNIKTATKDIRPLDYDFAEFFDRRVKQNNPENSVTLFDISNIFVQTPPLANLGTRFTPCCMLRLYADLIPELPDKILYLDNDVICRKDCSYFYNQNISEYEVAGVLDHYGRWFFRKRILKMDYLNSGVLLLNLKQIRKSGTFHKCRERCRDKQMFMPDQSAINKVVIRKKRFPRRFNEQRKLHSNTVFQHFTTTFRFFPWVHTVTVKPWQTELLHERLKIHEYDSILDEYKKLMENYKCKE